MNVQELSTRALRMLAHTQSVSELAVRNRVAARAELDARDIAAFAGQADSLEPGDLLLVAWDANAQA